MIDDIKDIFKNSGLEIPNEYLSWFKFIRHLLAPQKQKDTGSR